MNYLSPSRLLRATLAIDAAASGTLALIQLLAPYAVAQLTGLAVELLVATGVLLAAYAALLIRIASSAAVARTLVELVAVGNLGWALTCIVLATALGNDLSTLGVGYLLFQAGAVVAFASAQARGLMGSSPAPQATANLAWKDLL